LARIEVFYQELHDERELEYAGYVFKAPGSGKPIARIFNFKSHVPPSKHPPMPVVVPQRPTTCPQHASDDDDFGFVNISSSNIYIGSASLRDRFETHYPLSSDRRRRQAL
jgi:hypothetical protein